METESSRCIHCRCDGTLAIYIAPYATSFAWHCATCVLLANTGEFCPICLDVHDYTNCSFPDYSLVKCSQCKAMAHVACIPNNRLHFLCKQCTYPRRDFVTISDVSSFSRDTDGKLVVPRDFPKLLICAAKISSMCMRRAAIMSRCHAELKAREAVEASKRATEAIQMVNDQWYTTSEEDDYDFDADSTTSG